MSDDEVREIEYGEITVPQTDGTVRKFVVTRTMEMNAFDYLGPRVRATIYELPRGVLVFPILSEIANKNLDPQNPYVDAMVAQNLTNAIAKGLLDDVTKGKIDYLTSDIDVALAMKPIRSKRGY